MSKLFKQNSCSSLQLPNKSVGSQQQINLRQSININKSKNNFSRFSNQHEEHSSSGLSSRHSRRSSGIPQSARGANQVFSEVTKYHVDESQCSGAQPLQEVSHISKSHSAAMESFYLSSNVKVLVGVNTSDYVNHQDDITCISMTDDVVNLNFNEQLYKQYQFAHLFILPQQPPLTFNKIVAPHMDQVNFDPTNKNLQVTTILTYGQKSSGKSELLGSLFENEQSQSSLITLTLQSVFEDDDSNKEVYISCYEVFLETLTDLFDETNESFTTENDATWLRVDSLQQALTQLRTVFLNRKQIVDESSLSYSQSHLVVNIKTHDSTSEFVGQMYSFIDLVGFDQSFTQKIMDGDSFGIHNQSALQGGMINDSKLQDLIGECNDNNLFSLRNLLLAIENDNDQDIQSVLNETTLARVVFAKLLQSQNFYVIGMVNATQSHFNETLNTLEFCTKFQQALTPAAISNQMFTVPGDENLMTTECGVAALPQEVSAYLDNQDQMSRFYNNNMTVQHSRVYLNNNNQTNLNISRAVLNKSNVSMNSLKMGAYLERFFNKKQEEQVYGMQTMFTGQKSKRHSQSRNRMFKEQNPIRIHQDFRLETSTNQQMNLQKPALIKPPSERSTGFCTNTQLTHMRKYSQDLNMRKMCEGEQTFSELNILEQELKTNAEHQQRLFNLENFSKIQGKSKFDSTFLSTYIIHGGDTPQRQLQPQRSTILIQNQRGSSNTSNFSSSQVTPSTARLPPKHNQKVVPLKQEKNPLAQHFIQSVIKESMKAINVQMKDFSDFFLKDKTMEGCLPCSSNSNSMPNDPKAFSDIYQQKRQKFFDIDKVLREIEQKELRQQTLNSIGDTIPSHPSHRKNNKSVNVLKPQQPIQYVMPEPARQIQLAKQQLRLGQSILSGKENFTPTRVYDYGQGQDSMPHQSLNQLTFPLSTLTQRGMPTQQQESRVLTEILNIMNHTTVDKAKRQPQ